jgi:hypothetical protein
MSGSGLLEDTSCWSCGILGLIKIPPEKKDEKRDNRLKKEMTDEQIDMQSWDRKRQKMENLQSLVSLQDHARQVREFSCDTWVSSRNPVLARNLRPYIRA